MGGGVLFHQDSEQNHTANYEDNEYCKQNLHIFSFTKRQRRLYGKGSDSSKGVFMSGVWFGHFCGEKPGTLVGGFRIGIVDEMGGVFTGLFTGV